MPFKKVQIGQSGRSLNRPSILKEAISLESDLLLKLNPLPEVEIFDFMKNLRGGTYFNMGMYSSIPVSKAYKSTIRIYKVLDLTAIVSGVSYENIGTTKDFRQRTGEAPGKSWYDHTPGYENKIGQKKSDPNSKYVLWDIKRGSGTCVRYYVIDIDTGVVTPVSKADIENSPYLTATEKAKLTPKPVVGIDLTTGQAIENKTVWRTAAFDHIFWLSQAGKATKEYGVRFEEDFNMTEAFGDELFMDAHARVNTDLDAILSGEVVESIEKPLKETAGADVFIDAHAGVKTKLDDVLSGNIKESKNLKEAMLDDLDTALYTPGVWGVEFVGEDCVCFDNETDARAYFAKCTRGNIYSDSEGIELFKVLDTEGNTETIESISVYDEEDENFEESCKIKDLKESYRRTVSRGNTLVDNELFVDFD